MYVFRVEVEEFPRYARDMTMEEEVIALRAEVASLKKAGTISLNITRFCVGILAYQSCPIYGI